jgi:hypothetical protein
VVSVMDPYGRILGFLDCKPGCQKFQPLGPLMVLMGSKKSERHKKVRSVYTFS